MSDGQVTDAAEIPLRKLAGVHRLSKAGVEEFNAGLRCPCGRRLIAPREWMIFETGIAPDGTVARMGAPITTCGRDHDMEPCALELALTQLAAARDPRIVAVTRVPAPMFFQPDPDPDVCGPGEQGAPPVGSGLWTPGGGS